MPDRILRGALGATLFLVLAGCSEQVTSSLGCPDLCTDQSPTLRDTVLTDAVIVDSTITGFPLLGTLADPPLVSQGDTIDLRVIARFDTLRSTYRAVGATADSTIRRVDSASFIFVRDTSLARPAASVRIEAFDVDTTANDTIPSTLLPLFRASRLLGTRTYAAGAIADTIRIPLDNASLLGKITAARRLRIGLRVTDVAGASLVRLRVVSGAAPIVRLRVSADTLVAPDTVRLLSKTPAEPTLAARLALYSLRAAGTLPLPPSDRLAVGGVGGARAYLRFSIPPIVIDSVQVIRATLQLTQRPSRSAGGARDTVSLYVHPITSSPAVTDLYLANNFLGAPRDFGLDSTRFVPRDSGQANIEIVGLVRFWRLAGTARDARQIILRAPLEGQIAGELNFFSRDAAVVAVRPRLRLTYVPRRGFGLP